jgi:hypothetical protein
MLVENYLFGARKKRNTYRGLSVGKPEGKERLGTHGRNYINKPI